MRFAHGVGVLALGAFAAVVSPLPAQQPPNPADSGVTMTGGPVMRVNFFKVNAGMGPENQRDLRQHLVPIWEAEKAAGIILDYTVVTNLTTESPEDWNFGFALTYPNFAALDSLGARTAPITLKHYGSADARTAAGNRREQIRTLVRSSLLRVVSITRTPRP